VTGVMIYIVKAEWVSEVEWVTGTSVMRGKRIR
jgi:hypothetical protein